MKKFLSATPIVLEAVLPPEIDLHYKGVCLDPNTLLKSLKVGLKLQKLHPWRKSISEGPGTLSFKNADAINAAFKRSECVVKAATGHQIMMQFPADGGSNVYLSWSTIGGGIS